jgi:3-hydroxyacyl-[acyl-carrier-protein] dehydratase
MIKTDLIKKLLKQKKPFLFIDEIKEIGETNIVARFNLQKDEYFLKGHFPEEPVLPGVLLIEMIAQSALFYMVYKLYNENYFQKNNIDYSAYLSKVNYFNFKGHIIPDSDIEIKVDIKETLFENFYNVKGRIFEKKQLKCFGEIILYFKKN